jgi:CBS domain-containing protein
MEIMRAQRVGCLPVLEGDQLVGIVTSYDFLDASARLFQQRLAPKETARVKKLAQSA